VKLLRFRRPEATCSPSYVDYKPKTNAVILLDTGHIGGIGQGKKTKNLNVVDVLSVQE
jgi:hypothetical protein